MPMYEFQCINEHRDVVFVKNYRDCHCETVLCSHCGETMGSVIGSSNRMLYFEEGRARVMNHLGPEPVTVRSHAELERKMKERGLDFAGNRRGTKGAWI